MGALLTRTPRPHGPAPRSGLDPARLRAAIAVAVERDGRRLFAVAYAVLGRGHEAEDAVQDGCLRALGHAGDLEDPDRLLGWLLRIVRRAAIDRLRARRESTVAEDALEGLESPPVGAPQPALDPAPHHPPVRSHPDPAPLVVCLKYLGGMSYAEIAAVLDVPESTVLGRLQRARESLRESLRDRSGGAHGLS